jgi:hypothetical protein
MKKGTFDIAAMDQSLQLLRTCNRVGLTPAELAWLSSGENLTDMCALVRGNARITITQHVIDLSLDPPLVGGDAKNCLHHLSLPIRFNWNQDKVELRRCREERCGVHLLTTEDRGLNACTHVYLLRYRDLIPDQWKGKRVYFPGTTYRNRDQVIVLGVEWDEWSQHWCQLLTPIKELVGDNDFYAHFIN